MKVHGRNIGFLRTVKLTCELADMCPDGDLSRIGELFAGHMGNVQRNTAKLIALMNEGYEMSKKFEDPTYVPNPLTEEELLYLDDETFTQLFEEATAVFMEDGKPSVEVQPSKKKKKG